MAKRTPTEEKPFSPLDPAVIQAVISPTRQPSPINQEPEQGQLLSSQNPTPLQERMEREKRLLLMPTEERQIEALVADLAGELGTPIKLSHVLRACISLILDARQQILDHAQQSPKLSRPSNGDMHKLIEFEKGLARIVKAAIQDFSN